MAGTAGDDGLKAAIVEFGDVIEEGTRLVRAAERLGFLAAILEFAVGQLKETIEFAPEVVEDLTGMRTHLDKVVDHLFGAKRSLLEQATRYEHPVG